MLTPAQQWEYYSRVKRSATVEAAALPVERYAAKVRVPDEKELKEFFDECKTRYPTPDSPEPGFRLPKRIAVQYFRANVDKFVDLKSVTDAEIKEEYERDTDYYEDKDKSLAAEEKAAEAAKKTGTEKKTDAEKKNERCEEDRA